MSSHDNIRQRSIIICVFSDKHIFGLDNLYLGELGPETKVASGPGYKAMLKVIHSLISVSRLSLSVIQQGDRLLHYRGHRYEFCAHCFIKRV